MKELSNNKTILSVKSLIKRNLIELFILFVALFIFVLSLFSFGELFIRVQIPDNKFLFFFSIFFMLLVLFVFSYSLIFVFNIFIVKIKQILYIKRGYFKIVEDKIYDRCIVSGNNNSYFLFTKIFGKILVDYEEYHKAEKDDIIYILVFTNKKYEESCDDKNFIITLQENGINLGDVVQKYLKSQYEIGLELKDKLIPYNNVFWEANFDSRVRSLINELQDKKGNVKCKNCGKKYNLDKSELCPKCNERYEYEFIDFIHEKDWFK